MTGEEKEDYDYLLKIVLVGDSGVGKTNLLSKFKSNKFDQNSKSTLGMEFSTKLVKFDNVIMKAQIWDTSGKEHFIRFAREYYRGSVGAILVYDITRRKSFEHIQTWLKEMRDFTHESTILMLVGNKLDLAKESRAVSTEEATKYAQHNNMLFMETSASEGTTSEKSFKTIIERVYEGIRKIKKQELQSNSEAEQHSTKQQPTTDMPYFLFNK